MLLLRLRSFSHESSGVAFKCINAQSDRSGKNKSARDNGLEDQIDRLIYRLKIYLKCYLPLESGVLQDL